MRKIEYINEYGIGKNPVESDLNTLGVRRSSTTSIDYIYQEVEGTIYGILTYDMDYVEIRVPDHLINNKWIVGYKKLLYEYSQDFLYDLCMKNPIDKYIVDLSQFKDLSIFHNKYNDKFLYDKRVDELYEKYEEQLKSSDKYQNKIYEFNVNGFTTVEREPRKVFVPIDELLNSYKEKV